MSRTILDVHVLQTLPPSNVNRDDTGSPKTAMYGGVRRARVSSQAWKRATRTAFADLLSTDELGTRTKRVVELIGDRAGEVAPEIATDDARAAAAAVLKAVGIKTAPPRGKKDVPDEAGYLLFLSAQQIDAVARLAAEAARSGEPVSKADARALLKGKNSVDLALFGRMVADDSDLNVDAACQVAHAISTHGVEPEFDYYTAVDDHKRKDAEEDAGAGMIGTVEFNSSTLYRYATVDVNRLNENLGDATATRRAVSAFLQAFATSMPTGKRNTFANGTVPDTVVVTMREDQSVSYAGAFEEPVRDDSGGGRIIASAMKLGAYAQNVTASGFTKQPVNTWVASVGPVGGALDTVGEQLGFDALVEEASNAAAERIGTADATVPA